MVHIFTLSCQKVVFFFKFEILDDGACSTSYSIGNLVDGSPPAQYRSRINLAGISLAGNSQLNALFDKCFDVG